MAVKKMVMLGSTFGRILLWGVLYHGLEIWTKNGCSQFLLYDDTKYDDTKYDDTKDDDTKDDYTKDDNTKDDDTKYDDTKVL